MANTVRSSAWLSVYIKAPFLAGCCSSWYWKLSHANSVQVPRGNFYTPTTWWSWQTRLSSAAASWGHGRQPWRRSASEWTCRKRSSWSPVLGWMCWKTPGSFPATYAEVALETTPSNAPGASCGYTNGVAASRVTSSRTRSTPAPGAWAMPAPSTAVPPH